MPPQRQVAAGVSNIQRQVYESFKARRYQDETTPQGKGRLARHDISQYRSFYKERDQELKATGLIKRHPLDAYWRLIEDCEGIAAAVRDYEESREAFATEFIELVKERPTGIAEQFAWVINELLERGLESVKLAHLLIEKLLNLQHQRVISVLVLLREKIKENLEEYDLPLAILDGIPTPETRDELYYILCLGERAKAQITATTLNEYVLHAFSPTAPHSSEKTVKQSNVVRIFASSSDTERYRAQFTTVETSPDDCVIPASEALEELLTYGDSLRDAVYALAVMRGVLEHICDLIKNDPVLNEQRETIITCLVSSFLKRAYLNRSSSVFFVIESLEVVVGEFTREAIIGARLYLEWALGGGAEFYSIPIWGLIVCLIELLESIEGDKKERLVRRFFEDFLEGAKGATDEVLQEMEKLKDWALQRLEIHPSGFKYIYKLLKGSVEMGRERVQRSNNNAHFDNDSALKNSRLPKPERPKQSSAKELIEHAETLLGKVSTSNDLRRIAVLLKRRDDELRASSETPKKPAKSLTVVTSKGIDYYYERWSENGETRATCLGRTLPKGYDLSLVRISEKARKKLGL